MNREIKFRMWHKKSKKMFDVESINFKDRSLNMWNSVMYTLSTFSLDDVILMQYTGLHDKNGKEIYEGDIVVDKEDEVMGEITWNEEEASFYFSILYENGTYEEEKLNDWASVLEVIGNVYDNPELLGGE